MKSGIKAIVPVRSGSLRVANKNLASFAGSNLLAIKIQQLLTVSDLDEICVSSNDKLMLEWAERLGATPIPRDPYYATNEVPMSEVYAYMASQINSEHIMLTHVTNPLVSAASYNNAIAAYKKNIGEYDSLTTVSKVQEFLYLDGKAINYNPEKKPRSQDLPPIVRLNHAISILPRQLAIDKKDVIGFRPFFQELDQEQSVDIDTPLDFEIAEFIYNRKLQII